MKALRILLALGVALALLAVPALAAADTGSGVMKINNPDVSEPTNANHPNRGECGAAVVLIGYTAGATGTVNIVGQGDEAGPDTFEHSVTIKANGQGIVNHINLRDGRYKASSTLSSDSKVFSIVECAQTEDPRDPDKCPDGSTRPDDGECPGGDPGGDNGGDNGGDGGGDGGGGGGHDSTDVACLAIERGLIRVEGLTRIETAVAVSQQSVCADAAESVVLARSDLYPDALAGTPLAVKANGPLLLTPPSYLHDATAAEIQRVLPAGGTVYFLGGTAALSTDVASAVTDLGYTVVRYGGENRFETAVAIGEDGLGSPSMVFVANGSDFPDALTSGTVAGQVDGAVILTANDQLPAVSAAYLGSVTDGTFYSVGGPASGAFPSGTALVGTTRFETAIAVAEELFDQHQVVGVATGGAFADALTGGTMVARAGGPMLLSGKDALPATVGAYLESMDDLRTAILFGGVNALSAEVEASVRALLR